MKQSAIQERFELLGADREAHAAARAELWEERLQALAARFAIDLNRLPAQKSAPEKLRLATGLKQITSASNRWLAHRLQMGAPTGVSSFLCRFRAGGGTYTRSFKAAVGPFMT